MSQPSNAARRAAEMIWADTCRLLDIDDPETEIAAIIDRETGIAEAREIIEGLLVERSASAKNFDIFYRASLKARAFLDKFNQ